MISTPFQSMALDRIIASWFEGLPGILGTMVKIILAIVENLRNALLKLDGCCRKTGETIMALQRSLSRPMMPNLGFLRLSARALRALACKPAQGADRAAMMNLRGKGAAEIRALATPRNGEPAETKVFNIEERLTGPKSLKAREREKGKRKRTSAA